jgi:Family of unknown function (DUF5317)
MLLLYFVAAGVLLGSLAGGRVGRLAEVTIRWWAVALCGLAAQLLLFAGPVASRVGSAGPALYVASTAIVLVALLRNRSLRGFHLIAAGAAINLAVIVANGGYMPSSPDAWAALNGAAALPTADYTNSALAGAGTTLAFLGDIFVLPRPLPFANVFSFGDVLIGLGGAWFIVHEMRRPSSESQSAHGRHVIPPVPSAHAPGGVES